MKVGQAESGSSPIMQCLVGPVRGQSKQGCTKNSLACVSRQDTCALFSSSATCVCEEGRFYVVCARVSFLPASRHSKAQADFFFFQVAHCVCVSLFFSRPRGESVPEVELFTQHRQRSGYFSRSGTVGFHNFPGKSDSVFRGHTVPVASILRHNGGTMVAH